MIVRYAPCGVLAFGIGVALFGYRRTGNADSADSLAMRRLMQKKSLNMFILMVRRFLILVYVTAVAACTTMPAFEQGKLHSAAQSESYTAVRDDLVRYSRNELGAPYAWGGAEPGGFDCSGLVYYVYGKAGLQVPRTTEEQLAMSTPLDAGELKHGDLVFFDTGFWQTHVGIYLGNGEFIHAPGSGDGVMLSSLSNTYWQVSFINGGSFLHE